MKKSEIEVKKFYKAKVSNKVVTVRVDKIDDNVKSFSSRSKTRYTVTNMATGRQVTFQSAARFRGPAVDPSVVKPAFKPKAAEPFLASDYSGIELKAPPLWMSGEPVLSPREGEQRPDPTPAAKKWAKDNNSSWVPEVAPGEVTVNYREVTPEEFGPVNVLGMTRTSSPTSAGASPAAPGPGTSGPGITRADVKTPSLAAALSRPSNPGPTDLAPHVIVDAKAGTGKTTTLVGALHRVFGLPFGVEPSDQQRAVWDVVAAGGRPRSVVFCAFNSAIARELGERVPRVRECSARTMHSLGYYAVRKAFGLKFDPDDQRGSGRANELIAEVMGADLWALRREKPVFFKAARELVRLCKMNLIDKSGTSGKFCQKKTTDGLTESASWEFALNELASHYDVEMPPASSDLETLFQLVPTVLERCKDVAKDGYVDFNDMIWLPVVLKLPVWRNDLLLVDECVPGWTPVMLADGQSVPIREIVESEDEFRVRSYDTTTGTERNCRVVAKQKLLNQKPLVKVKVKHLHRTGTNRKCNFVICTTDHKVWTVNRGWVESGNLKVGDDVIVETAAETTQKGKVTKAGRDKLSELQTGNQRGLGNVGGDRDVFNSVKGGNGRGPSLAESVLMGALNSAWPEGTWVHNHVVKTGDAPQFGRGDKPSHYKLDIAFPDAMIAVEVDGDSHRGRRGEDDRKDKFLASLGWAVLRVTNRAAIQQTATVVEQVVALSNSAPREGDDCPRPARVVSVEPVTIPDFYVYDITVEDCHNFYANGILVHNCQDLNRCQQALARMAGSRLVLCGDPNQAIYGFAGADAESMTRMEAELSRTERGCVKLPLTVTRRCGKAIVREANAYVRDFQAHESNGPGKVSRAKYPVQREYDRRGGYTEYELKYEETYLPLVTDGDMVLCRANAPLVRECFRFLKRGRRATIQGRKIGEALVSLVEDMGATTVPGLVKALQDWLKAETDKEMAKRNPSEEHVENLQDRVACLMVFCGEALSVEAVKAKVDSIFTDKGDTPGVRLSSIHKAKGLESRRVFYIEGFGRPEDKIKNEWEREQETNLRYVAITRAIEELVFVS